MEHIRQFLSMCSMFSSITIRITLFHWYGIHKFFNRCRLKHNTQSHNFLCYIISARRNSLQFVITNHRLGHNSKQFQFSFSYNNPAISKILIRQININRTSARTGKYLCVDHKLWFSVKIEFGMACNHANSHQWQIV